MIRILSSPHNEKGLHDILVSNNCASMKIINNSFTLTTNKLNDPNYDMMGSINDGNDPNFPVLEDFNI